MAATRADPVFVQPHSLSYKVDVAIMLPVALQGGAYVTVVAFMGIGMLAFCIVGPVMVKVGEVSPGPSWVSVRR